MKHTKGEWRVKESGGCVCAPNKTICQLTDINDGALDITREVEANAKLIAEAGTVANETGFTPRQLADQKAKLLEALKEIAKGEGRYDPDNRKHASNTIEDMKVLATNSIKNAS